MKYFVLVGWIGCMLGLGTAYAQAPAEMPVLPAMKIDTFRATHILTWNCQFEGVKSIAIQRSSDSIRNYSTIFIQNKVKKGIGSYTDLRPLIGKNYYRLSVNFAGDLEWFSNTFSAYLDSATVARVLQEDTQMEAIRMAKANAIKSNGPIQIKPTKFNMAEVSPATPRTNVATSTPETPVNLEFHFTPSAHVYTNPYSGHVNINLEDFQGKKYSLRFYTPGNKPEEVLRIARITRKMLVVDKHNFNSTGTYKFELFSGEEKVETGYVTIY